MRTSPLRLLVLSLVPALFMAIVAILLWPLIYRWQGDVTLYARYGQQLLGGAMPYRDFPVEYPPLALLAFALPQLVSLGRTLQTPEYVLLFLIENALFCAVTTFATLQIGQMLGAKSFDMFGTVLVLVLLLAPVLPWRYDMFPTMLSALGVWAVLRNRQASAGWWLGAGAAAKLFPAVLGPLVALHLAVQRRWHALAWLVAGGVVALAVTVLPAYLLAGNKLWGFLAYHQQRGLQIESVAGGIVALGSKLGWTQAQIVYNFGAMHFASPWADVALPLLTPLLVVVYVALLFMAYRSFRVRLANGGEHRPPSTVHRQQDSALVMLSAAALLAFIVTSKVFSPQYLVWLVPFVPLLRRDQIALFVAICGATIVIFPFQYEAMLALEWWIVILLNLRNAATVGLLLWITHSIWHAPRYSD